MGIVGMPNHCNNRLIVNVHPVNPESMEQFRSLLNTLINSDKKLSFMETFIPVPEEHKESIDWRYEHWGSKWGDYDCGLDFDVNRMDENMCQFTHYHLSAYGPNFSGFETISKMFPLVNFDLEYDEPGMNFRGEFLVKNGEIKVDKSWQMTKEDWIEVYNYDEEEEENTEKED